MTDEIWLKELFKFENCDECGKGADYHTVSYELLGLPRAICFEPDDNPQWPTDMGAI